MSTNNLDDRCLICSACHQKVSADKVQKVKIVKANQQKTILQLCPACGVYFEHRVKNLFTRNPLCVEEEE
jgi:hypothetical protein